MPDSTEQSAQQMLGLLARQRAIGKRPQTEVGVYSPQTNAQDADQLPQQAMQMPMPMMASPATNTGRESDTGVPSQVRPPQPRKTPETPDIQALGGQSPSLQQMNPASAFPSSNSGFTGQGSRELAPSPPNVVGKPGPGPRPRNPFAKRF